MSRVISGGTTGYEIFRSAMLRMRFQEPQTGPSGTIFETDSSGSVRFGSPLIESVDSPVIYLDFPHSGVLQGFRSGTYSHLDFADRDYLDRSHDRGVGHHRGIGQVTAFWCRKTIDKVVGEDAALGEPLVLPLALGGGTGSSLGPNFLEANLLVTKKSGTDISREVHLVGLVNSPSNDRPLMEVELLNEYASLSEIVAIAQGGECFPQASQDGLGESEPYQGDTNLYLLHNPGDRGGDQSKFIQTVGNLIDLMFEDAEVADVVRRESADKRETPQDPPSCRGAGAYQIHLLDEERYEYQVARFSRDVLEVCLTPNVDADREGRSLIRTHRWGDDGRQPGLSMTLIDEAFDGKSPFNEKYEQSPPICLGVERAMRAAKYHVEKIERDIQPLLAQVAKTADLLRNRLPVLIRNRIAQLASQISCASLLAILNAMSIILEASELTLQKGIEQRLCGAQNCLNACTNLRTQAKQYERSGLIRRHLDFLNYLGIPRQLLRNLLQRLRFTVDAKIFELASGVQRVAQETTSKLINAVNACRAEIELAKEVFERRMHSLSAHTLTHRGFGCCLEDPDDLERYYQDSKIFEKFGQVGIQKVNDLMVEALKNDHPAPPSQTLVQVLTEYARQIVDYSKSNIEEVLHHRNDTEGLFRQAIRQAAPLLSKDTAHTPHHEILIVKIPNGSNSPFAETINKITTELRHRESHIFIPGPSNSIQFLHVELRIPLRAVLPLRRAEEAYERASRSVQYQTHRMPIFALLPSPMRNATAKDAMESLLMGVISGRVRKLGNQWGIETNAGSLLPIQDLESTSILQVFGEYRLALESRSKFICDTLTRGFAWANSQLRAIGQQTEFTKGYWPNVLLEFQEKLSEIAQRHHKSI